MLRQPRVSAASARAASAKRLAHDCSGVCGSLQSTRVARSLKLVTSPPTLTVALRNTGIALALAPEPVTTVVGIALVGASMGAKSREPSSLTTLRAETSSVLDELKSLRFVIPTL